MRILFVKTSSLGDVVHHCPAVTDMRGYSRSAVIDWVVEEPFADIAAMHPAINRVIPVNVRRWRSQIALPATWTQVRKFDRELRAQTYDLVIDTQGLLKSALIAWRARGSRHGFDSQSAREAVASRFYDKTHRVSRQLHAVERNRALTAQAFGTRPIGICNYGVIAPPGSPLAVPEGYCVLLSMTSRIDKLWPDDHWAALVRALAGLGRESVLPWGNKTEQARSRRIADIAGSGVVPRRMSIGEVASLMARSAGVFGVDTGLAHLAVALGVRSIGIFCGTDPRLTGLYGQKNAVNVGGKGLVPSATNALQAFMALI